MVIGNSGLTKREFMRDRRTDLQCAERAVRRLQYGCMCKRQLGCSWRDEIMVIKEQLASIRQKIGSPRAKRDE